MCFSLFSHVQYSRLLNKLHIINVNTAQLGKRTISIASGKEIVCLCTHPPTEALTEATGRYPRNMCILCKMLKADSVEKTIMVIIQVLLVMVMVQ